MEKIICVSPEYLEYLMYSIEWGGYQEVYDSLSSLLIQNGCITPDVPIREFNMKESQQRYSELCEVYQNVANPVPKIQKISP